jgi:hypothetical protein
VEGLSMKIRGGGDPIATRVAHAAIESHLERILYLLIIITIDQELNKFVKRFDPLGNILLRNNSSPNFEQRVRSP